MYKDEDVYVGKEAENQSKKVLILGESHYSNDGNVNFTTKTVINDYKKHFFQEKEYQKYRFFHKIAQSFNINKDNADAEFAEFWDYVYFGNYVEELCGIRTDIAKNFIKSNRVKYNDNLFSFINENNIDMVLVFSRLVFNNSLPSLSKKYKYDEALENLDDGTIKVGKCRDYISHCRYLANINHKHSNVMLNKNVDFYGLRHPSAWGGYKVENYIPYLNNIIK